MQIYALPQGVSNFLQQKRTIVYFFYAFVSNSLTLLPCKGLKTGRRAWLQPVLLLVVMS